MNNPSHFISNRHKGSIIININRSVLIYLFLVITTLTVYWQVRNFEFINFDDPLYVTDNYHVQSGLTLDNIIWAFTAIVSYNWHPLTLLSHMLDCQLFGMNSGIHHLINLFFHLINTLLLFSILKRMSGDLWKSAFVAAMFALHPLHVESVAWVSERKDVLSTFFWMLTIRSYIKYVHQPGIKRYLQVILLFIMGLMSKPMLVTLPYCIASPRLLASQPFSESHIT
jgi:hypothetical protein